MKEIKYEDDKNMQINAVVKIDHANSQTFIHIECHSCAFSTDQ